MEIKLLEFYTGKSIYAKKYTGKFEGSSEIEECRSELHGDNYQLEIAESWFEGVHISMVEFKATKNEDFVFYSSKKNIGFLYCLNGTVDVYCEKKISNIFHVNMNQQSITSGQLNNVVINLSSQTKYIYIQLTEEYFRKIANVNFSSDHFQLNNNITAEVKLILQGLNNDQYTGRLKRLFIESKILELIIFYLNQQIIKPISSLKKDDIEKILLAKSLVENNLQKPHSLIELSRKAGINDFKLKKGFKELTGYTVFGYLYKIRMEKACYYLTIEKKAVNEVSFLVGYKNSQHFITAFKKLYNVLPGSLNKN